MTSPIRVVHLITGLNTGGAEIALARLLSRTDHAEFDSRVVSLIPLGPVAEQIRKNGILVDSLEMPPGRATLKGFLRLLNILHTFRPHILQTWLYHADLLGLLAGKIVGIPVIVWNVRSSWMDFSHYHHLSGLVMRACAWLSRLPSAIVINSQAGLSQHESLGYHPATWEYIPNGVDTDIFSPNDKDSSKIRANWQSSPEEIVIGLVGRLDPQKDYPNFLRAAKIIQQEMPETRFICVGDGPKDYLASLQALAHELGLGERVLWAGPRKDMPAIYNAFDLLVLPSAYGEGFPNVVAEAMACGKPCVVTDVGDSAYLVDDTGISVPPGNPESLAQAILQVLKQSEAQRSILGEKARQRIGENFSIKKMTRAYRDLYKRLA